MSKCNLVEDWGSAPGLSVSRTALLQARILPWNRRRDDPFWSALDVARKVGSA